MNLKISRIIIGGVITIVLAGMLSSCAPQTETAPAADDYYSQQVEWTECGESLTCTTVAVPTDWSNLEGESISLSLVRHSPASGESQGALFVNPGGPGGSGVAFVRDGVTNAVDETLAAAYDIIGFDPRGVGESTPVTCTEDASGLDAFLYGIIPGVRGSEEWLNAKKATAQEFIDGCEMYTGELLQHLDTLSVAKDLDLMRAVVGEEKLNYLGYSYGTFIGMVYAQEFPQNVGYMVLDGAVDPSAEGAESPGQAAGFEMALGNWIEWCLEQTDCPFSGTPEEVAAQIATMLADLDENPLPASDGRLVGGDTFASGITSALYSPDTWPDLSDLFLGYLNGDVDPAIALADWYNGRYDDGTYVSNDTEAFLAIGCSDSPATEESTWAESAQMIIEAAPVLGPYFTYVDVLCSLWPSPPVFATAGMKPTGDEPIIIIGTTGDPSTPIEWAEGVVESLTDGRLITYSGEGHLAYNRGDSCVNTLVNDFFINDVVPPENSSC
jgi:pimeloyl-ACP methyl ester carboxylesterase